MVTTKDDQKSSFIQTPRSLTPSTAPPPRSLNQSTALREATLAAKEHYLSGQTDIEWIGGILRYRIKYLTKRFSVG